MPSKYWIKLYHEILDDPKMGRLTDRLFKRVIQCFLLAGEYDKEGYLPSIPDVAWRMRISEEELETDFADLASVGILQNIDGRWCVTKFVQRQSPVEPAERMKQYRERKRKSLYYGDEPVTIRNTDTDTDIDTDIDTEEEGTLASALELWGELFPDKPQPRAKTKSLRDKWRTRWQDEHFRTHWNNALIISCKSKTLQKESWFNFQFFIKNDSNYQKMLDNWMAWKDEGKSTKPKKTVAEILQER